MTARLTINDFAPQLGKDFSVDTGDSSCTLRLVEVTPAAEAPEGGGWVPFSLVFDGPAEPLLPQATYRLEDPDGRPMDVFLVPIATARYEAVFG
ncbi:MAG: hypothetical protein JWM40_1670 [Frankiales bacterium]|nr:hypothetical protein [Frankiales bacterium]